jgi:arylsulfatase A
LAETLKKEDIVISRRSFGSSLAAGALGSLLFRKASGAPAGRPPNLVIFLADDLGYGDLSCYGNRAYSTPRLDRMANEGARLTEFYAMPTCTPARAALLTGRYPVRSGLVRVLIPREHFGIPESEITLAQALKPAGYQTACIGKWHLGDRPPYRPNQHGFDYFYGLLYSNDMEVLNLPRMRLYRNTEVIESPVHQRTLTRRYTEEAKQFIAQNRERPFLLYLPYNMPHAPVSASPAFQGSSEYSRYGDAVKEIDWSVGEVLDCLKQLGLDQNTLTVFTSDNGPRLKSKHPAGSAGGLRGGKSTTWEGGVRVPCIIRWPNRISPGITRPGIACLMDLFTTCVSLAGAPIPTDRAIDGANLVPFVQEGKMPPHSEFYYYYGPHLCAVRAERWKLHLMKRDYGGGKTPGSLEKCRPPELYDLESDPGETHEVGAEHPEIVETLTTLAEHFQDAVQVGQLPKSHFRSLLPRLRRPRNNPQRS